MVHYHKIMKKYLIILLFLLPHLLMGQNQYEHRGTELTTHGNDFWVCFPRPLYQAPSPPHYCLYIMAEHNCDVTISNDLLGYEYVHHVRSCHTITWRLDTLNLICLPEGIVSFPDTIDSSLSMSSQPVAAPLGRAFHITSTDTISVYLFCSSASMMRGDVDVTNVFPTELLRAEYIVQTHWSDNTFSTDNRGMFQILATEDNTVVDIELSDMDWLGRPKDSVITVTLDRGQLYNVQVAPTSLKYSPLHYTATQCTIPSLLQDKVYNIDTNITDLSGTHIKARDHKRIAVFQGNQSLRTCSSMAWDPGKDLGFEQALPMRFAGKEFLTPNIVTSYYDWIQFTALVDGTEVTVRDPNLGPAYNRTLHLDARKSSWIGAMETQPCWLSNLWNGGMGGRPTGLKCFGWTNIGTGIRTTTLLTCLRGPQMCHTSISTGIGLTDFSARYPIRHTVMRIFIMIQYITTAVPIVSKVRVMPPSGLWQMLRIICNMNFFPTGTYRWARATLR